MRLRPLLVSVRDILWFVRHPRKLAKVISSARILLAVLEHGWGMQPHHAREMREALTDALGPVAGPPANRTIIAQCARMG